MRMVDVPWLVLAFAVTAMVSFAEPIPKSMRDTNTEWMPVGTGWKWEYCRTTNTDVVDEIREVISTEKRDEALFVVQRTSNLSQTFRKDATGLALIESGGAKHANPRYIIKPNMKQGDSWTWDAAGYVEKRTVGKLQEITVPAGKFKALPVEFEYNQNGTVFRKGTVWYAAGVGLIRIDSDGEDTQVLKAFTRGK